MTHTSPFQLDFRSTNGRLLGRLSDADGGRELYEYTTWLRVRSDVSGYIPPPIAPADDEATGLVPPAFMTEGLAVLIVTRSHEDFAGKSIGLYRRGIETGELEQLRRLVELTPWSELPQPSGGQYTAPQLELSYSSGDLLIRRGYNAKCGNFREAIRPLEDALDELATRLMMYPVSLLGLEVWAERAEQQDSDHWLIHVKLENRSAGSIVLTDPRIPQHSDDPDALDDQPRLELRVGEVQSDTGVPPYDWTILPLPPLPADGSKSLILAGRSSFELSAPWVAPRPGRFAIVGEWQDYGGPIEPVAGQLPFMPLPERGTSVSSGGPYPVRGAAFASHEIEVPVATERMKR